MQLTETRPDYRPKVTFKDGDVVETRWADGGHTTSAAAVGVENGTLVLTDTGWKIIDEAFGFETDPDDAPAECYTEDDPTRAETLRWGTGPSIAFPSKY